MIDLIALGVVGFSAVLLVVLIRLRRKRTPRLRPIAGLTRLYRALGLSVEDGTRILLALGGQGLLNPHAASSLAGLGLVREISQKASLSDRPPVAVSGDAALALLSQDSLLAGYRAVGAAEYFQPATGRLAGLTPFSSAAATIAIIGDEDVSAVALVGQFGPEAGLLSEAANRSGATILGASSDPATQAVLFATATDTLIGEELFAAPAYISGRPSWVEGLTLQDVLRWILILGLLAAAVLKFVGLI